MIHIVFALELAVGILSIVIGFLLWKKQKLSLLHAYHYKNVKKKDLPAYARLIGIGLICIGVGICTTALLQLLRSSVWWIPMLVGFALGLMLLNRAQKQYNGSWLG